jgi:hypothetical protein
MELLPNELLKDIGRRIDSKSAQNALASSKIFAPFADIYTSLDIKISATSELFKLKYISKRFPCVRLICLRFFDTIIDCEPELIECNIPVAIRLVEDLSLQVHVCKSFQSIKYCNIKSIPTDIYMELLQKVETLNLYILLNNYTQLLAFPHIQWPDKLNYVEIFWFGEVNNGVELDLGNIPGNTKHLLVNNIDFQTIITRDRQIDGGSLHKTWYRTEIDIEKLVVYVTYHMPLFTTTSKLKEIYFICNEFTHIALLKQEIEFYLSRGVKVFFYGINEITCQVSRVMGTLMPQVPIVKLPHIEYDKSVCFLHQAYNILNIFAELAPFNIPLRDFEKTDPAMNESFHQVLCKTPVKTLLDTIKELTDDSIDIW